MESNQDQLPRLWRSKKPYCKLDDIWQVLRPILDSRPGTRNTIVWVWCAWSKSKLCWAPKVLKYMWAKASVEREINTCKSWASTTDVAEDDSIMAEARWMRCVIPLVKNSSYGIGRLWLAGATWRVWTALEDQRRGPLLPYPGCSLTITRNALENRLRRMIWSVGVHVWCRPSQCTSEIKWRAQVEKVYSN